LSPRRGARCSAAVLARVPGPDFMLVVQARDMPHYLAISQTLFTQDANVRNVKAFFATKRAKFTTTWPVLSRD
jgi:Lrp/AsnC family transcriptional regulator, leucine-responsive regulatory protein